MKLLSRLLILLWLGTALSAQQIQGPPVHFAGPAGPGGPFPFFNSGTITLPSDADYTLLGSDTTASVIRITTAAGVSLSATRNIIAPQAGPPFFGFEFTIQNATAGGRSIVVKGATGNGVTIPNGQTMMVVYDGTNYVNVGSAGVGTVTTFAAGALLPLFTSSVATPTTTPALTFTLSTAAANTVFGNFGSAIAAPTFKAVAACGDSTHALGWIAGTGFTCQTLAGGTGTAGLQSINSDTTQAQNIVAGAGIGVSTAAGTTTISNTGVVSEIVFRGVSDAVKDSTCGVTAGSPNLTCTDAPFATCPTGKTVSVTDGILQSWSTSEGNFTLGNSLITTIASCISSTVAVLNANATNTVSNIPARWGTDNGPALLALANAPATQGSSFVIPPGNYLVHTVMPSGPPDAAIGNAIDVYPNTSYTISGGTVIYWVGPTGCDGNDVNCQTQYGLGEDGIRLFHLHGGYDNGGYPSSSWPIAHNSHIQIDGIIEGDLNPQGASTRWNNSAVIGWYGWAPDPLGMVRDISIDGSGSLVDIYAFGIHGVTSVNTNVRHLNFYHVHHALNVNGSNIDQSFNHIVGGTHNLGSVETTGGANNTFIGNVFDGAGGVSLGGTGQNTYCSGFIFAGNVFTSNTHGTNLQVAMCPVGAIIANNTFWISSGNDPGPPTAINFHDGGLDSTATHDNMVINNVFDGAPDCYADVVSFGVYTGANIYDGNHSITPCYAGYLFFNGYRSGAGTPLIKPEIVKNDSLSTRSGITISVQYDDVVRMQGPILDYGPNLQSPNYTADSWYTDQNGQTHNGLVSSIHVQIPSLPNISMLATDPSGNVLEGTNYPTGTGIPTFTTLYLEDGYSTIGTQYYGAPVLTVRFISFTPSVSSTVRDLQLYEYTGYPATVYAAIYDSDGTSGTDGSSGAPGTMLCQDTTGTGVVTSSWNTLPGYKLGTCPQFAAGHKYFMGFMVGAVIGADTSFNFKYDNATFDGTNYGWTTTAAGTWPSSVSGSAGNSQQHFSGYIHLYNANGGWGPSYSTSNAIPPAMLGTGMVGDGSMVLADNNTWVAKGGGGGGGPTLVYNSTTTGTSATAVGALPGYPITMITPTADTNYRLEFQFKQTNQATTCTTPGTVTVRLGYTDADTNLVTGMSNPGNLGAGLVQSGNVTNLFTFASTPGITTSWYGVPVTFKAKGGQPVTIGINQNTASAGCGVLPTFLLRVALYVLPYQ